LVVVAVVQVFFFLSARIKVIFEDAEDETRAGTAASSERSEVSEDKPVHNHGTGTAKVNGCIRVSDRFSPSHIDSAPR
jgi:hypothetical protein